MNLHIREDSGCQRLKRNDFGEGPISLSAHYPATGEQQNPETYQLNMALDQTGDGFYNSDLLEFISNN